MIALSIAMTWLTLTAAGFAALSALGRMELRNDVETDRASLRIRADRPHGHVAAMPGGRRDERPRSPVERPAAPALRLLQGQRPAHPEPLRRHARLPTCAAGLDGPACVLLAGSDAGRRAALLDELAQTLPASTVFAEADAVCDVLEHAPDSRMAFITGDLDDAPAESLMHDACPPSS